MVALRWGHAQGRGRVGTHDPWGCECLCRSLGMRVPVPHWGMLGFRPTISSNGSLLSSSWCSRASPGQTFLSETVADPADSLAVGWGFVCTMGTAWDASFPPTEQQFGSLALALQHSPSSAFSYTDVSQGHFLMSFLLFIL